MFKRISQIFLIITVLLTVLGNTVRIGVCPCHKGIFFGECVCNLHSDGHSNHGGCQGCPDCGSSGQTLIVSAEPGQDLLLAGLHHHNSGTCENATLKATAPFIVHPPFKIQDDEQSMPVVCIAIWPDTILIEQSGAHLPDQRLWPPPDLYRDMRQSYAGYMRPSLA